VLVDDPAMDLELSLGGQGERVGVTGAFPRPRHGRSRPKRGSIILCYAVRVRIEGRREAALSGTYWCECEEGGEGRYVNPT
jgi:hypothetical protein